MDVDVHHGDGTQQIFYRRADVLTVSMHADPVSYYPFYTGYADETGYGEGDGFNLNFPLPHGTDDQGFLETLAAGRTEERRVGKEGVSTGRSRGSPDH